MTTQNLQMICERVGSEKPEAGMWSKNLLSIGLANNVELMFINVVELDTGEISAVDAHHMCDHIGSCKHFTPLVANKG